MITASDRKKQEHMTDVLVVGEFGDGSLNGTMISAVRHKVYATDRSLFQDSGGQPGSYGS